MDHLLSGSTFLRKQKLLVDPTSMSVFGQTSEKGTTFDSCHVFRVNLFGNTYKKSPYTGIF